MVACPGQAKIETKNYHKIYRISYYATTGCVPNFFLFPNNTYFLFYTVGMLSRQELLNSQV